MATKEETTLDELHRFCEKQLQEKSQYGPEVERLNEEANKLYRQLEREIQQNKDYKELTKRIEDQKADNERKKWEGGAKLKRLWLRIRAGKNLDKVKDELVALAESLLPPEPPAGKKSA